MIREGYCYDDLRFVENPWQEVYEERDELRIRVAQLEEASDVCKTSAAIAEARHRANMYRAIAGMAEEEAEAMRSERDEWEDAYWRQHAILAGFIRESVKRHMRELECTEGGK